MLVLSHTQRRLKGISHFLGIDVQLSKKVADYDYHSLLLKKFITSYLLYYLFVLHATVLLGYDIKVLFLTLEYHSISIFFQFPSLRSLKLALAIDFQSSLRQTQKSAYTVVFYYKIVHINRKKVMEQNWSGLDFNIANGFFASMGPELAAQISNRKRTSIKIGLKKDRKQTFLQTLQSL